MDAIKECIDEKYHKYIKSGNPEGSNAAAANPSMSLMMMSQSGAVGGVPFPPKAYPREYSVDHNVFVDDSKWDVEKLRCSPRFEDRSVCLCIIAVA